MKKIAVQGCSVEIKTQGLEGAVLISTPPSTHSKAGGAAVYRGDITVVAATVTETATGNTAVAVTATISGSSQNTKADGQPVILEGDKGTATAVPFVNPSGSPVGTKDVEFYIKSAGQDQALTE